MDAKTAATICNALSDESRQQIVNMLASGEICACEFMKVFDFTQPTLSHHLKTLLKSTLVKSRKSSKWVLYSLDRNVFDDYIAYMASLGTPQFKIYSVKSASERDEICKVIQRKKGISQEELNKISETK